MPPDQVYQLTAKAADGAVTVHFDIKNGYYLYKSKFQFHGVLKGGTMKDWQLPAGETKADKYFGQQEIYRDGVTATAAYTGSGVLELDLVYQGCADIGFCYPPQKKHLSLTLPAAAPAALHPTDLQSLVAGTDSGEQKFLPPEQAFHFIAEAKDPDTLEVRWQIAPGYYLYRQKFHLVSDNPDVALGTPDFPQGEIKNDAYFGTSEIYTQDIDALIPLTRNGGAGKFKLTATYQGCAEQGFCYPPITQTVALDLSGPGMIAAPETGGAPMAEQDRLAALVKDGNLAWLFLAFVGFGLLLTFTPCVLPMLPIISGVIVGQGKISTSRAFFLSLTYVLAMAFAYMVAGVLVGLLGGNIQAWLQNPWVLSAFSLLFVLLALSMFELYHLQMPSAIQSWLTHHSNRAGASRAFVGVAIMGMLCALICGPCITAPLVAALVVIGETGSGLRGGVALFALGLGMGVPLLIVGTSAGKFLPKAGPWMHAVKATFGVLMLAVAIWFMARVLPGPLTLALWAALAIVSAVYLGALDSQAHMTGWRKFWKGLGLLALIYGLILLVGAALGGDDPFRPLAKFSTAGGTVMQSGATSSALPFKRIKTVDELDAAVAAAAAQHKPVMLDFYADWCVSCKELEHDDYTDAAVQAALADAVLLQVDVTADDAADQALFKRFGIYGPPSVMFFGADGAELRAYRVVGYIGPKEFLERVEAAFAAHTDRT